ncbi:MAG: mechanosensitive ion channel, partial [Campylobacterales bacterium]|nr:mechanosensitive ion channel [Campylobacterales bacterium]
IKTQSLIIQLQKKDKLFFETLKEIQQFVQNNNLDFEILIEIYKYLSREYIGLTHSAIADTKTGILDVITYSWDEINKNYIPLGDGVSILDVVKFLLIFIIGFTAASFYKKKIIVSIRFVKNSSPATRTMLANLGYYFLIFLTFMMALKSVGIDLSSLTMLVGALSVGIGFGLQNIVSNFISGIILIFEQSIKVGDIIEIEAGIRGKVTQINMRSSIITTFDNIEYIVPNSTFIQSNVINLTLTDDIRRLSIPFGVAYGSDVEKVSSIILNELEKSELVYIKNDQDRMPKIRMSAMGASSVDMTLLVWIDANSSKRTIDPSAPSDFLTFVYKTLNANNIEIPFPQMDLHIKTDFRNKNIDTI